MNLSVAVDESVLDEQHPYQPERALWTAVLVDAIEDYWHVPGYLAPNVRPLWQRQVRVWFDSQDRRVGSFWWICQVLGLDPCAVRSRIGDPECHKRLNTRFQH